MNKMLVLVVDEEFGSRVTVKRALENFTARLPGFDGHVCFDVDGVSGCEEALEIIESSSPDILLIDHKCLLKSGLDILDLLVKKENDLLAVIITAYVWPEMNIDAAKRDEYHFLSKPFKPCELYAGICEAARHLALHRRARKPSRENSRHALQKNSLMAHELEIPLAKIEELLYMFRNRYAGDNLVTYDLIIEHNLRQLHDVQRFVKNQAVEIVAKTLKIYKVQ